MRFFFCIIASIVIIVADQRNLAGPLRLTLAVTLYPLQQAVSTPVTMARNLYDALTQYRNMSEKNRQLQAENLLLKSKLLKFEALEQENIRLRGLLDTSFKVGEQVLIAELLAVNLAPYEHIVAVNKGSRFGVYVSQPVFDASGVFGQVLRVMPNSAEVILITDPNHAIPVQVNRNGLRTIAVGSGHTDRLLLPYLTSNADIQAGDLLVTSGLGGVFPQGYPVATVETVTQQTGAFSRVSAVPTAQLDRSREVLLVWSKSEPIPRGMSGDSDSPSVDLHAATPSAQ